MCRTTRGACSDGARQGGGTVAVLGAALVDLIVGADGSARVVPGASASSSAYSAPIERPPRRRPAASQVAERSATLDIPLNLRIDKDPDTQLRHRAAAAQIPVSGLVRRLLREAITHLESRPLAVELVEQARRPRASSVSSLRRERWR